MPVISVGDHDPTLVRKALGSPDAIALAEIELLKHDLIESLQIAKILHTQYMGRDLNEEERLVATSLYRSSIMLWVSCFEKPRRGDLDASAVYYGDDLTFFRSVIDVRDSFIAHRFGPQRQSATMAVIKDGIVRGIQQGTTKYSSCGPDELSNMMRLIGAGIEAAEAKAKPLGIAVLLELRKMSPAEVAALDDFEITPPDGTQTRMSRKEFRAQQASSKFPGRTRPNPRSGRPGHR